MFTNAPGLSAETKRIIALWDKPKAKPPSWWVWTGGWYELKGEENYYFKHDYLTAESIVLEAGSYEGKFAVGIAQRYDCRVIGYEPSSYSHTSALIKTASYPKVQIRRLGLSDRDETRTLYDTHRDSANLFSEAECPPGMTPAEEVCLVDVAAVVRELGLVNLFTVNCEGWEFPIFWRLLETGEIRRIERMMIQWHSVMEDAAAQQVQIQSVFAETYRMLWNLGAWEMWST